MAPIHLSSNMLRAESSFSGAKFADDDGGLGGDSFVISLFITLVAKDLTTETIVESELNGRPFMRLAIEPGQLVGLTTTTIFDGPARAYILGSAASVSIANIPIQGSLAQGFNRLTYSLRGDDGVTIDIVPEMSRLGVLVGGRPGLEVSSGSWQRDESGKLSLDLSLDRRGIAPVWAVVEVMGFRDDGGTYPMVRRDIPTDQLSVSKPRVSMRELLGADVEYLQVRVLHGGLASRWVEVVNSPSYFQKVLRWIPASAAVLLAFPILWWALSSAAQARRLGVRCLFVGSIALVGLQLPLGVQEGRGTTFPFLTMEARQSVLREAVSHTEASCLAELLEVRTSTRERVWPVVAGGSVVGAVVVDCDASCSSRSGPRIQFSELSPGLWLRGRC